LNPRLLLHAAALVALSLAVQAVYLASPAQPGLPLDDGWIHATYARNLARHGQLCLNPGEPSTGTTSFLWTGLLAALRAVGCGPVLAPVALGLALSATVVVCCFLVVRGAGVADGWALAAGASCALLGPLVWIGLSGMEATMFVALGLVAVLCRWRGRPLAAGVAMGLLVLTRPEGLALPMAVAAAELWQRPRLAQWPTWLRLLAPAVAAAGIYVAVNLAVSGHLLTSTYGGRRWLADQPAALGLGPGALGARLGGFAAAWVRYLYRWVFGAVLVAWLGAGGAQIVGGAVGVAVALVALVGLAGLWLERRAAAHRPSPLPLLVAWAAAHNAAYVVFLPVHGHAGRYQAVNYALLAVLTAVGAAHLARRHLRRVAVAAMALWLLLCLGSAGLWRAIYRDSVDHIHAVHVACGRWIAAHLPPDAVVATYDLGAIAYFAQRRIVDLGGLADPEMTRCLFAGDSVPYMRRKGTSHLAMVRRHPGDTFLAERLGLLKPGPDRPALQPIKAWSVPRERYHIHHVATSNAMPRIHLFALAWPDAASQSRSGTRGEGGTGRAGGCPLSRLCGKKRRRLATVGADAWLKLRLSHPARQVADLPAKPFLRFR